MMRLVVASESGSQILQREEVLFLAELVGRRRRASSCASRRTRVAARSRAAWRTRSSWRAGAKSPAVRRGCSRGKTFGVCVEEDAPSATACSATAIAATSVAAITPRRPPRCSMSRDADAGGDGDRERAEQAIAEREAEIAEQRQPSRPVVERRVIRERDRERQRRDGEQHRRAGAPAAGEEHRGEREHGTREAGDAAADAPLARGCERRSPGRASRPRRPAVESSSVPSARVLCVHQLERRQQLRRGEQAAGAGADHERRERRERKAARAPRGAPRATRAR